MRPNQIGWAAVSKAVRGRDNDACVLCGEAVESGRLSVHHIVPYRICEEDDPENLVSLCKSCHAIADGQFNYGDKGLMGYFRIKTGAIDLIHAREVA